MFDLLIRNASILNGIGAVATIGDLGVRSGLVVEVGRIPAEAQAAEVLDAAGLTLAPGFIDIHTHADIALLARPEHLPKVMQGVTTEVFTNCGLGFAPCTAEALETQREYLGGLFGDDAGVDYGWRTVGQLLERYEKRGIGTNAAYLIPHSGPRVSVMGMHARAATDDERATMVRMVREGMEAGAWGLSTGLWYAPMCHADRAETVALAREAGFFATHQRSYKEQLFEATEETIAIAEEAGVPAQLSHLQLSGPTNKGRAGDIIAVIEAARARGVDIAWDSYPYRAGSTMVQALLPAWATEGGRSATMDRLRDDNLAEQMRRELGASLAAGWDSYFLAGAHSVVNAPYEGLSFQQIADRRGLTPPEFVIQLLIEDELQACYIVHHVDEADVRDVLAHPLQTVGSDGLHLSGKTHPRLYATFPRVLGHYVREERALTLEEAVRKMTSAAAARLGIRDRGVIAPGKAADLVLFDPATIRDTATFEDPLRFPEGIPHVWVNGVAVKRNCEPTHALPGRVLRRASRP